MHSKMDCVSRSPLFAPLTPAVKAKLITVTHHRKFYQKGQLIRQPLDHQEGMLILDEGTAKIYALAVNGKEKIIELLRSGDVVGQHWLFLPRMKIKASFKQRVMRGSVPFNMMIFSGY